MYKLSKVIIRNSVLIVILLLSFVFGMQTLKKYKIYVKLHWKAYRRPDFSVKYGYVMIHPQDDHMYLERKRLPCSPQRKKTETVYSAFFIYAKKLPESLCLQLPFQI